VIDDVMIHEQFSLDEEKGDVNRNFRTDDHWA